MEHIKSQDSLAHAGQSLQPLLPIEQLKHELVDSVYQSNNQTNQSNSNTVTTHKRTREDDSSYGGGHKDDPKKPSWQTARENPPSATISSTLQTQLRSSLLPDPEPTSETHPSYNSPKSTIEGDDVPRLPSIKQMRLDTLESPHTRSHWDYYSHHASTSSPSYQAPPPPPPPATTSSPYSAAAYRSPLGVTQTINPPPAAPPPASYTTELVPIKTNNFGFIETTFTTAPVKKAHKRRPANVDKTSLFCHSCGSKTTPEWRRGPQGPATASLCNACGLAYAKRVRQDEEAAASSASRAEQQQQQQQQQLTYDYNQSPSQPYYSLSYLTGSPPSTPLSDPYQLAPSPQPMTTLSPYSSPQLSPYIPYEQLAEYAALSGYNLYSPSSRGLSSHSIPTHSIPTHSIPTHSSIPAHSIPLTPSSSPMASPMSNLSPTQLRSPFRNGVVRSNGHTFHQYNPPVTSRTSSYINFSPNYSPTVTTTTTTTLMPHPSPPSNSSYLPEPNTSSPPSSSNTQLIPTPESYNTSPTIVSSIQPRTTQPMQPINSPPQNPSLHLNVQPTVPATQTVKTDQQQLQQPTQQSTNSSRVSPSLTPLSTIATLRPGSRDHVA